MYVSAGPLSFLIGIFDRLLQTVLQSSPAPSILATGEDPGLGLAPAAAVVAPMAPVGDCGAPPWGICEERGVGIGVMKR